ncbi:MAG: glycosyltransferase family 2 protein [Chloroflexota bacterium]
MIVPCRDEVGNVAELVGRLPCMGSHTELIFVDGRSIDGTAQRIERLIVEHPERDIKLLHQNGEGGKAAAVFQGFDAATGDILLILDADMTVAPEDLALFYGAVASTENTFANGTRFALPMAAGAMPPMNRWGNRLFSHVLSFVVHAPLTDTLCGTKALRREDWGRIEAVRPLFGGYDPWGDFDLLFGAAYCGLRIEEVPVAYGSRQAGESKMHPLRDGWVLGRSAVAGWRQINKIRSGTTGKSA